MKKFDSAIRAAEESRTHRAASQRVRVIYKGKPVLGQIIYEKGDYRLTFAGLMLTSIKDTPYKDLIDKVKEWYPV